MKPTRLLNMAESKSLAHQPAMSVYNNGNYEALMLHAFLPKSSPCLIWGGVWLLAA